MKKYLYLLICILSLFLLNITPILAQQTIFNVPSSEITPKGKLFLEPEFQFTPWNPGRNMLNTNFIIFGLGHNTEAGMVIYNVSSPDSNNITLAPGFKSAIPIFPQKLPELQLKTIVGTEVLVSVQGGGVGNWSFAELSGRVPKIKTRLTGGVSAGTKQIFGRDIVCFIGGIEQPVTKNLTLQADWFSGTHTNAFLIPGIAYVFPKNTTIYIGYQIPNNSRSGRSGFVVELAKLF